jgi:hypothetical protein
MIVGLARGVRKLRTTFADFYPKAKTNSAHL